VIVPFIVDMMDGIEDNVKLFDLEMNMLERQREDSKKWKNTSVQFLAVARDTDDYFVLVGGRHIGTQKGHLLVMCDSNAEDLLKPRKKCSRVLQTLVSTGQGH
jgi:hypothetical protein